MAVEVTARCRVPGTERLSAHSAPGTRHPAPSTQHLPPPPAPKEATLLPINLVINCMAFLPAVAVALALAAQAGNSPVNDIPAKYRTTPPAAGAAVARVNGVEIKAGDVESLLWDWRGFDAIQDLVSYQMIKAEAQKE